MSDRLKFTKIASLGRSYDEYCKMFSLDEKKLTGKAILDVASGTSSFCAEANIKGYNVIAGDPIYALNPFLIKEKLSKELKIVADQLPGVAHLYKWKIFKNFDDLKNQRQKALNLFLKDFEVFGNNRYLPVELPITDFSNKQFDICLISHLLFVYDDHLNLDFHKKTVLELARISKEIRIFPMVDMGGKLSSFVNPLIDYLKSKNLPAQILNVDYEFIKGGNQTMIIQGCSTGL